MPRSAGSNVASVTAPSRTIHTDDVAVVVSSSRPSSPRNTSADMPRPANTPAMIGHIRRSAQPTAAAVGRAGLVSGPRKLNTVGTPSAPRAAAVWRSAGWNSGAKQNVTPISSATRAVSSGGRSITTPSRSSRSAAPHLDVAARFPCLTTRAPAAAATTAPIVEMFTVCARSPPVPTMSTRSPEMLIGVACWYIASASPVTSAVVSPLARSATANAAICTADTSPDMISFIAQAVSSAVSDAPPSNDVNSAGQFFRASTVTPGMDQRPAVRDGSPRYGHGACDPEA